jgi:hypothetical protein
MKFSSFPGKEDSALTSPTEAAGADDVRQSLVDPRDLA